MAATLAAILALATDTAFLDRVKPAIVRVAVDIIIATNDLGETATPVDKARRRLAEAVIDNRDGYTGHFAWTLATRDAVTSGITDAALLNAVAAAWNQLSKLDL